MDRNEMNRNETNSVGEDVVVGGDWCEPFSVGFGVEKLARIDVEKPQWSFLSLFTGRQADDLKKGPSAVSFGNLLKIPASVWRVLDRTKISVRRLRNGNLHMVEEHAPVYSLDSLLRMAMLQACDGMMDSEIYDTPLGCVSFDCLVGAFENDVGTTSEFARKVLGDILGAGQPEVYVGTTSKYSGKLALSPNFVEVRDQANFPRDAVAYDELFGLERDCVRENDDDASESVGVAEALSDSLGIKKSVRCVFETRDDVYPKGEVRGCDVDVDDFACVLMPAWPDSRRNVYKLPLRTSGSAFILIPPFADIERVGDNFETNVSGFKVEAGEEPMFYGVEGGGNFLISDFAAKSLGGRCVVHLWGAQRLAMNKYGFDGTKTYARFFSKVGVNVFVNGDRRLATKLESLEDCNYDRDLSRLVSHDDEDVEELGYATCTVPSYGGGFRADDDGLVVSVTECGQFIGPLMSKGSVKIGFTAGAVVLKNPDPVDILFPVDSYILDGGGPSDGYFSDEFC